LRKGIVLASVAIVGAITGVAGCGQLQSISSDSARNSPQRSSVFDWMDTASKKSDSTASATDRKQNTTPETEIYYGGDGSQVAASDGRPAATARADDPPNAINAKFAVLERGLSSKNFAQDTPAPHPPSPTQGLTRGTNNSVNLNFENADIKTVSRAILGDVLNVNYAIDPRVSGTISLSTRRPVMREQLLTLLESALRLQGIVIVQDAGVYRLAPDKDVNGMVAANVGRDPGLEGYGVTALPLENISSDSLFKILDGFGARSGSLRVDADRNLLIVQGTYPERQQLIDNALAFDVEWMRDQSVGIFPIQNGNPDTVISELEKMSDGALIKFQPISRMNAVLAISKSKQSISRVATWISRLDRMNDLGVRVRVYHLRNADARRVASLVRDAFGGTGGATGLGVTDQVAPGTATVTARVAAATPQLGIGRTANAIAATTPPTALDVPPEAGGMPGASDMAGGNKIRVIPDVANNAVLVYASQADSKMIERTIRDLDRAPAQIAIEATVAEITLNDNLRNGVQVYLTSKSVGAGTDKGSFSILNDVLPLARVVPGVNLVLGPETGQRVVLDMLRQVTDVKVLSSPSLMVVDSQPAILQVGDQVPVTTRTAQDVTTTIAPVVNSIDFRDTGVILRVTPRMRANGTVSIEIEQEISAVKDATGGAGGSTTATTGSLTPTISQRKVKSTVSVVDGQTFLLAGLISEQRNVGKSGLPVVMDIPIFGNMLTNHTDGNTRTELIIFIKPQIVRNAFDGKRVAEDLRWRMKGFERW
jgi:general secretion pathway protein D